ncbi:MAG: type II toxin-antitoxin system VapC family toxin [Candidatus Aenigmarchaeota archaeon]|nr:type II toxin-antitoxin system VapC family toxin [Candidatus Aenigmarchaeota archaeon]
MIILDSSFIVAYYNTADNNHKKAVEVMKVLGAGEYGDILITDYVFDETVTVAFVRLKSLRKTVEIGDDMGRFAKIIYIEKGVFEGAWELFKNQLDTKFSFTDCSSLAIMKKEGINNIVTFDEDFKKIKEIEVVAG